MNTMQCVHCATPIPDDSRFCLNCGSNVSDADGQKRASATMDGSSTARMERILREDTKGEFEIERQLGQGGMAAVYLATEVRLGRKIAIKVLPPELTFGHGIERFVREAKTAAALDHPNIIPIYRITSGDTIFWYAMKYIEGKSLDEMVKEQKMFSVEETVRILGQAADALDYAHRRMVIHRDVKPGNLMLDDQGRVIVTDFGIAKALTEGTLTASGAAIGTPYYMSPEQAMGGTVAGTADQYSLGVVAYQMLSGQLPFAGESAIEILHKHTADPPPPLEVLRPGLPKYVYAAVAKAMAKKPGDRHAGICDFVGALQNQAPRGSVAAPMPHANTPPRFSKTSLVDARPKRAKRGLLIGGGIAIVVAGAAAALVLKGPRGGAVPADTTSGAALPPPPRIDAAALAAAAVAESTRVADSVRTAATRTPVTPTTGRVVYADLPKGARFLIDGRPRTGPSFDLPAGQHLIRVDAEGFLPFADTVARLRVGETVRRAYHGKAVAVVPVHDSTPVAQPPNTLGNRGVIMLTVDPWASIAMDGVVKATSPRWLDTVSAGRHLLTLQKEGYVRMDTTIVIRPGVDNRISIHLRANP